MTTETPTPNPEADSLIALFSRFGLDEVKSKETAKNKKLSKALKECIEDSGCEDIERAKGLLLYLLASKTASINEVQRKFIVSKVINGDIKSDAQVLAAVQFMEKEPKNMDGFDAFCGVNVVVSEDEILVAVKKAIEQHSTSLLADRYQYNFGAVLKSVKELPEMRWADRKLMKDAVDAEILALLGPKTEADLAPPKKQAALQKAKTEEAESATRKFEGDVLRLHKPGENKQLNEEIMKKHLQATGGKVVTRFPPEPNGFLHIGHAKAMNFSFRYAEKYGGNCYLRYDDTNPEAEKQMYYDSIREMVDWLGFKPYQVTAASDYFPQLYEYAVELIKRGKAYVCHMTNEEIHASRGGDNQGPRYDSPFRNRPIEESLREFERMKNGEYKEGEATLRLKQDMQSPNPCMWDLVAYRVLYTPHCRTGRQWNIYPMYDYTHCLCDSLENITHSLCTTEFINAREAYYWVCDQLEVYKAVQWEYGRLNITNTVLSKRKLTRLVTEGVVKSWDDPRLYTLAALRRRGFPASAINRFVEELGITTASSIVDVKRLDNCVRDELNRTTLRRMVVVDPIKIVIDNWNDICGEEFIPIVIPNDPRDPAKGDSVVPLQRVVYIDGSDFQAASEDDPNYYRFTPSQTVGLFKAGILTCKSFETDEGRVTVVHATIDRSESASKPKTFIQWVPSVGSFTAELRMYRPLFKSENPDACPGGFLSDVNPDSLIIKQGLCDPRLRESAVEEKFQFQRLGYFCKDADSTESLPVFNLTVSIKEDPNKV